MEPYFITLLVAFITTLAAILAPTITAIINNRFLLRSQKDEYNRTVRRKSFERYLSTATKYIYDRSSVNRRDYIKALTIAYLYAPEDVAAKMYDLDLELSSSSSPLAVTETHLVITARSLGEMLQEK